MRLFHSILLFVITVLYATKPVFKICQTKGDDSSQRVLIDKDYIFTYVVTFYNFLKFVKCVINGNFRIINNDTSVPEPV